MAKHTNFEISRKKLKKPTVVFDEEFKTGIGFKIGPRQRKYWRKPKTSMCVWDAPWLDICCIEIDILCDGLHLATPSQWKISSLQYQCICQNYFALQYVLADFILLFVCTQKIFGKSFHRELCCWFVLRFWHVMTSVPCILFVAPLPSPPLKFGLNVSLPY